MTLEPISWYQMYALVYQSLKRGSGLKGCRVL